MTGRYTRVEGVNWQRPINPAKQRKLTDDQARDVRRRLSAGESLSSIGRLVALPPSSIAQIRDGLTYREVTP